MKLAPSLPAGCSHCILAVFLEVLELILSLFLFFLMFSHHGAGCCCHAGILDSQVIAETKKHYVGENSQLCPSYSRGSHQIRFCLKLVRS